MGVSPQIVGFANDIRISRHGGSSSLVLTQITLHDYRLLDMVDVSVELSRPGHGVLWITVHGRDA